jgi:hypothetical protein
VLAKNNSGNVLDTHSVGSIGNLDLCVFAITEITTKHAAAVPPMHLVTGTPNPAYAGLQSCYTPTMPLTRFAVLARWQSLLPGHIAPH